MYLLLFCAQVLRNLETMFHVT